MISGYDDNNSLSVVIIHVRISKSPPTLAIIACLAVVLLSAAGVFSSSQFPYLRGIHNM